MMIAIDSTVNAIIILEDFLLANDLVNPDDFVNVRSTLEPAVVNNVQNQEATLPQTDATTGSLLDGFMLSAGVVKFLKDIK